MKHLIPGFVIILLMLKGYSQTWQSQFILINEKNHLQYLPDKEGDVIPDFSRVGYASGEKEIPDIEVVESINAAKGDNTKLIQNAIDRIGIRPPDKNGFRGAVLLKKGTYRVDGTILIKNSGIVIRGEGSGSDGTLIIETASLKTDLFSFRGEGSRETKINTIAAVSENFVPVGRDYLMLQDASSFKAGDSILIYRPATENWIHDLKMDQIEKREGLVQWKPDSYPLYFERIITRIDRNKVYIDNPVVMQLDKKYGGGFVMKYTFPGRISQCGIENLRMESTYRSETDEDHGWNAISFSKVSQAWVRNVVSRFFGYSCVTIDSNSRNISVLGSQCLDAKSQITGSRRYSFNCGGQLNLFKDCYASEGRHDYVTGARVCGPNVFTRCKARNTHSDIGPHHRWASGTLFDMIDTDGEINVQDRGNYGTGHGWAGVTQIVWNCRSPKTSVQSPWVSGYNYCIGLVGGKWAGRFPDRPDGAWEGLNKSGLLPESLYDAQLKDRLN